MLPTNGANYRILLVLKIWPHFLGESLLLICFWYKGWEAQNQFTGASCSAELLPQ